MRKSIDLLPLTLILFLIGLLRPVNVQGESEGILNKLLAPGPLISGHKDLEAKDCLKCHDAGKGISASKCLDCHKELKTFVDSQKGFHGIAAKSQTCMQCHSDHKGREFDTTKVDEKNFDHFIKTGYTLEGKHAKVKCSECHTQKRTQKLTRSNEIRFLGTKAASCKSCHKKDDVHFYIGPVAQKDCNACHGNMSWKENIRFKHDSDTKYKLVEHHGELKCNDCHLRNKQTKQYQYQWPELAQRQCLSCHDNFHKNRLGPNFSSGKCTTCHNQTHWTIAKFDHGITGYKLVGKHSEVKCVDCHKPAVKNPQVQTPVKELNFTGLKKQCLACHQDFHKFGRTVSKTYGDLNQCSKCHEEASWTRTHNFDHNKNTRFVIEGKHLDLKCKDCHIPQLKADGTKKGASPSTLLMNLKGPTYHWETLATKTCESCHKNPHIGQFSKDLLSKKCSTCHTAIDWFEQKSDSGFDHGKTRFQLTGSHRKARCNDCHGEQGNKRFKFSSVDKKFCMDCHDNIHKNQFKGNWDVNNCSQCHSTEKFSPLLEFNHNQTRFPLKDSHEKLECSQCHVQSRRDYTITWPNAHFKVHTETLIKPKSVFDFPRLKGNSCRECHEDFHRGQLGQNCSECHTEKSWQAVNFDHNEQSDFPLRGKHTELKCEKCHKETDLTVRFADKVRPVVRFRPLPDQCYECHKDPHVGNYGKSCQECHSEKSWKSTKDFHKNFTLGGVHFTLVCSECHKDGKKLAGLSQQCLACHQKDDVHNGATPNCGNCHTQHFWEVTSFRHSMTRFALRGAHRVIECTDCHNGGVYKGLSSNCYTCHKSEFDANPTPHAGVSTNCLECHKNTFTFGNPK